MPPSRRTNPAVRAFLAMLQETFSEHMSTMARSRAPSSRPLFAGHPSTSMLIRRSCADDAVDRMHCSGDETRLRPGEPGHQSSDPFGPFVALDRPEAVRQIP